jgi:hypothetical protein
MTSFGSKRSYLIRSRASAGSSHIDWYCIIVLLALLPVMLGAVK